MLNPLDGAERLDNGALFYRIEDKELSPIINNEDKLRDEFEKLKASSETWDVSEEEQDAFRLAILEDMDKNKTFSMDEFNEIIDKELSIFKGGEKYDYVRDLKDAFRQGLAKPAAQKIFETIPNHAFWDIKKPLIPDEHK
jgi:hypothetical protein